MTRFTHVFPAALALACTATLSACGSSSPVAGPAPPLPTPSGPVAPLMRCAPDANGSALVAQAGCTAPQTERRS